MRKSYEALSVDVVKFEAQDVITASGTLTENAPTESAPGGTDSANQNPDQAGGGKEDPAL